MIIPDLNINAPLIDTEENGVIDFSKENFDEELTKGVVKYPTTPTPGNKGNTLIFGHTSSEWWKKNEYGVIFRNIPKLKAGQRFGMGRRQHTKWLKERLFDLRMLRTTIMSFLTRMRAI